MSPVFCRWGQGSLLGRCRSIGWRQFATGNDRRRQEPTVVDRQWEQNGGGGGEGLNLKLPHPPQRRCERGPQTGDGPWWEALRVSLKRFSSVVLDFQADRGAPLDRLRPHHSARPVQRWFGLEWCESQGSLRSRHSGRSHW
jgi:hypothetical protein